VFWRARNAQVSDCSHSTATLSNSEYQAKLTGTAKKHQNQQRQGLLRTSLEELTSYSSPPNPVAGGGGSYTYSQEPHAASALRSSLLQFWTQTNVYMVRF